MPCFKGIAVSIHANGSPLPEYGIQKQSRVSRISSYIPVPKPRIGPDSKKPEPSRFAISITLLTPHLPVPYSTPKPTEANSSPKPQYVGPGPDEARSGSGNGNGNGCVTPYIPTSGSENETIAAYIYFDGRAKEEVATLLRPGEETWVNSRWVQIPISEGGGLAEREFLFREVGLEKWLNGLDLKGHDAAERLEKRRQKFEHRRRRQPLPRDTEMDADLEGAADPGRQTAMRYGADDGSPLEAVDQPDLDSDSFSDDDDDEPPQAAGQIKVAMFRVLASGEIRKGEYSPQFNAHDDDEDVDGSRNQLKADVEHTTSFAKPKTLDPRTISTQTVTGIDGPEMPYATFTFFYRGEKQLQKVGILSSSKQATTTPTSAKRRSGQLDFSGLGPLKMTGTVGFSAFRDDREEQARRRKARKKGSTGNATLNASADNDDSSDDDSAKADGEGVLLEKMDANGDRDDQGMSAKLLAPEDAKFQGELADGLGRIKLKRAHSAEPDAITPDLAEASAHTSDRDAEETGSQSGQTFNRSLATDAIIGSPLKKQKPFFSSFGADEQHKTLAGAVSASAQLQETVQSKIPAAISTDSIEEEL